MLYYIVFCCFFFPCLFYFLLDTVFSFVLQQLITVSKITNPFTFIGDLKCRMIVRRGEVDLILNYC